MRTNNTSLDQRAQLFLVGAIALALTFVGLTLLLNSAIFSDNLASRGPDTGGSEAQRLTAETEAYLESQLFVANANQSITDVEGEVTTADNAWVEATNAQFADRGAVTRVQYTGSNVEGTRLAQDMDRTLTPNGSTTDIRWFPLNNSTTDYELELYLNDTPVVAPSGNPLFITVGKQDSPGVFNSSAESVYIYTNGAGELVVVRPSGGPECTVPSPNGDDNRTAFVDLTDGKVNGEPCSVLQNIDWSDEDGAEEYSIRFENTDLTEGQWTLTTEKQYTDVSNPELSDPTLLTGDEQYAPSKSDGQPYLDEDAIYRMQYNVWYSGPSADYGPIPVEIEPDANRLVTGLVTTTAGAGGGGGGGGGSPPSVTIDSTSTTNVPGGNTDFTVQYTASDPDGDLNEAKITLTSSSGSTQTFTDPNPSGGDYSDTVGFNPSTIEVEVVDTAGNTDTDTSSI